MVICLERGADLHMAQLMPLPLAVCCFRKKSRLVLPFWHRLTRVVWDKGPLNKCVCVCVYSYGRGVVLRKEVGGRLKQDLDKDLQLHRILILLY